MLLSIRFDAFQDSNESERDCEIPDQKWKSPNESEKSNPGFIPGPWQENQQCCNKDDRRQCGIKRCNHRMTRYSQTIAVRQRYVGQRQGDDERQERSAEAVLPCR